MAEITGLKDTTVLRFARMARKIRDTYMDKNVDMDFAMNKIMDYANSRNNLPPVNSVDERVKP